MAPTTSFSPTARSSAPTRPPTPSLLYRNDGKGHFTEVGQQAGFTRTGWAQAVCVGDFDNDGRTDLLVTYYGPNSLYRNLGNGKFADVAAKAGLPVAGTRWGAGCALVDYDRDGYLDIFVSNYVDLDLAKTPKPGSSGNCEWKGMQVMCGPRGLPKALNALYHNNRDGTFTDVSEKAGILAPGGRYGLGVVAADFDNDGWPDIYVACDQTPSLLYRNKHDGTFEERGGAAGVAFNMDGRLQAGMGVAVADYDGNGFLDIAKTNFSGDRPSLYRNEDGGFFEDVSERAGLGRNLLLGWGIALHRRRRGHLAGPRDRQRSRLPRDRPLRRRRDLPSEDPPLSQSRQRQFRRHHRLGRSRPYAAPSLTRPRHWRPRRRRPSRDPDLERE